MKLRPAMFRWKHVDVCVDGGEVRRIRVMVPHNRFTELCKRQFIDDDDYALGPVDEVSGRSRAHLFASIKEAWNNLPEDDDKRFPTPEYFRKWLLVEVKHCTEATYPWDTERDAKAFAISLRKHDTYAVIKRSGNTVRVWTAKSIASHAVKHEEFQRIKTAVLDLASSMSRTTPKELTDNAGGAA